MQMQMTEMQKDRIFIDDADVELQYLTDELAMHKVREKKRLEEEQQRVLASMQDSVLDDTGTEHSTLGGQNSYRPNSLSLKATTPRHKQLKTGGQNKDIYFVSITTF